PCPPLSPYTTLFRSPVNCSKSGLQSIRHRSPLAAVRGCRIFSLGKGFNRLHGRPLLLAGNKQERQNKKSRYFSHKNNCFNIWLRKTLNNLSPLEVIFFNFEFMLSEFPFL